MAKEEWYYLEGKEQMGPVTEMEIRKRLVATLLRPRDVIWKEGMDSWTRIEEVEEFAADAPHKVTPPGGGVGLALGVPIVGGLLKLFGALFGGGFYQKLARIMVPVGHCALLAAMVFVLLLSIFGGEFAFGGLMAGLLLIAGILVVQFVAHTFLSVCSEAIKNNKSSITCRPLLDALAVLGVFASIYFLVDGVIVIIDGYNSLAPYVAFIGSLSSAAVALAVACVGLNPENANTETPDIKRDAGDEFLGICAFLSKLLLAIAPIVFAFGVLSVVVGMGVLGIGHTFGSMDSESAIRFMGGHLKWLYSGAGVEMLYTIALYPVILYLFFLCGWLLIRVFSAIIVMPGKVDKVADALLEEDGDQTEIEG